MSEVPYKRRWFADGDQTIGEVQSRQVMAVATRCFWCGHARTPLTRDHVVPASLGGGMVDNIVAACAPCQQSRGEVTKLAADIKRLRSKAAKWSDLDDRDRNEWYVARKKLAKRVKAIQPLVERWKMVEELRWGDSPTARIDLTVPPKPKPVAVTAGDRPDRSEGADDLAALWQDMGENGGA